MQTRLFFNPKTNQVTHSNKVGYTTSCWISDLFHPVHSAEFHAKWAPSVSVTSYF